METFAALRRLIREIKASVLSKIFSGGGIIGECGFKLGIKRAEEEANAVDGDAGAPFAGSFDEVNAFEAGSGFGDSFTGVLLVGGIGSEAQIEAAVVEAIVVMVVNEQARRRRQYDVMHPDDARSEERASIDGAEGVVGPVRVIEPPFESAKFVVVGRVNNCEPEFLDVNEADRMAIAEPVIKKSSPKTQTTKTSGNLHIDFYERHNHISLPKKILPSKQITKNKSEIPNKFQIRIFKFATTPTTGVGAK